MFLMFQEWRQNVEQQTKNVSLARKGRYYDVDIWLKLLANSSNS